MNDSDDARWRDERGTLWREKLFVTMSRNAMKTNYFSLPPERVVELGAQLEI